MINIKNKYKKIIAIIISIFMFTTVLMPPKKAEAISLELILAGIGIGGTQVSAIGTGLALLGAAGVVIVGGAATYAIGKAIYDKFIDDKVLNSDGSVTVNDKTIESVSDFVNNYDATKYGPTTAQLNMSDYIQWVENLNYIYPDGITQGVIFQTYHVKTTTFSKDGTAEWQPLNIPIHLTSGGTTTSLIMTTVVDGIRYQDSFNIPDIATNGEDWTITEFRLDGSATSQYRFTEFRLVSEKTGVRIGRTGTVYYKNLPNLEKYGTIPISFGFSAGTGSVLTFPAKSISADLNYPESLGDDIDTNRIRDKYNDGTIVYVPQQWVNNYPLDSTETFNPDVIGTQELDDVQSVDDPITYDDEKSIDSPTWWEGLFDGVIGWLKNILDAILGIPALLKTLWAELIALLTSIIEWIISLPMEIANRIGDWISERVSNPPGGGWSLPDLFNFLILIILALIRVFAAALGYIVAIRNIPANPAMLPGTVQRGISWMKNLNIGFFNMSFYSVCITVVFILSMIKVIKVLRKQIHKEFG